MKCFYLLIFSILFFKTIYSQNNFSFKNYTIRDGLSQSTVTTVLQDQTGYIWVGTQNGLNRFDGKQFSTFSSFNSKDIKSDFICNGIITKSGNLFFGTNDGILKYNSYLDKFTSYIINESSLVRVTGLEEINGNQILFSTRQSGFFTFNTNDLVKTKKITANNYKLPSNNIHFFKLIDSKNILVSTVEKELFIFNIEKNNYKILHHDFTKFNVNKVVKVSKNNYLLATNLGLYQWNKEDNKISKAYDFIDKKLGNIYISDIIVDDKNRVYLTTETQGLIVFELESTSEKFYQHIKDYYNDNSILSNTIHTIFQAKDHSFWIGADLGLSAFNPYLNNFFGYSINSNLSKGLYSPNVWSFSEDVSDNSIYIGTEIELSRFSKNDQTFEHLIRAQKKTDEYNDLQVFNTCLYKPSQVLVGTTKGLLLYNYKTKSIEKIDGKKFKGIKDFERVYLITKWKENKFFISTSTSVFYLDFDNNTFKEFNHNTKNPSKTIKDGICRLIYTDKKGKVWFSTDRGGLSYLIEKDQELEIYPYKGNNIINKLSKDYITVMHHISGDEYWIGTSGSGLIKMNFKTNNYTLLNQDNGLSNNVIYGILEDNNNSYWISSNKGLSRIGRDVKSIKNYSDLYGLMSNEFNQGAFLKSHDGLLYFGGIFGFNVFNPNTFFVDKKPVKVTFSQLKIDTTILKPEDNYRILNKPLSLSDKLIFPHNKRSFSITFIPSDIFQADVLYYKYKLVNNNEIEEVNLGQNSTIQFNSLSSGDYKLYVYTKKIGNNWNSDPAVIEFTIQTPFWKSISFWSLISITILLLIVVFIRKRIDNERRQQVILEMKIAERTREIREQNLQIEKQKKLIEEKKNQLEQEKEKTESLLKNIIPESTYEELKATGKSNAKLFEMVTVLFTDFVGFSKISERLSPNELVSELDIYFRKFDEIIIRNNLEKIKTIGDAYMCAGGVPVRNNTNPIDACLAALQIQDTMYKMQVEAEKTGRTIWKLRLGINTGEVTAGVIGVEKLAYDIWGPTVNKAQRMEMLGEPGKVTISENTYKYIKPYFNCTFQGKVKSKSKELIDMYTVDSIKSELSINGEGIFPNENFHKIVNLHFYSQINYYKAERHIMNLLKEKLETNLYYHSINHTKDVCKAIERLAILEGLTDEGLFLLKTAALYHDAGFIENYDKNEPQGARMAEEILPQYGYSKEHIEEIKKLIYVTQVPHKPTNKMEEIICDADLDYLGRDDFHEIADLLRMELRERGKVNSDRAWDETQVKFLTAHVYFTETAKRTRNEKKAKNLEEIKARLLTNNYKD